MKMNDYGVLLTNDDGWDSPGIICINIYLLSVARPTVLAPHEPHSYCGHRVTTDRELQLRETGPGAYSLSGSPADCVRVGLRSLLADQKVGWVISGINRGGNLGADLYTSGTVAAAREAALLGVPAIAISQYIRRDLELDWAASVALAAPVLAELMAQGCEAKTFWNVNLPHLATGAKAEVVHCEPDDEPLDVRFHREGDQFRYAGSYQGRGRTPGRDVDLCFGGAITISKLRL
jgi:5'-nucleotidase